MKLKKIPALLLILALVLSCTAGCGTGNADSQAVKASAFIRSTASAKVGTGSPAVLYKDCPEAYEQNMEYHDNFTVLQLTDIHWSGGSQIGGSDYGSKQYLRKVINEAVAHTGGIDLIEVTGDTFMLANSAAIDSFIDFMTEIGIPYAMVWGNHDREGKYNPNYISNRFLTAPYSLYTEVDNDNVHERCNYVINLTSNGRTVWQLIQLDSGASYRSGAADLGLTYDYLRDDQFAWMSFMHDRVGSDVPALCYYHIAQLEHQMYWDKIQAGNSGLKNKFFKLEGFAASDYASSTLDVFKTNNVKGVFIGHDHGNDWTFTTEDGVVYGLGVKSGSELYTGRVTTDYQGSGVDFNEDFELTGASLVTLTGTDGSFKLEHLYLNERDEGDFVMWVEY